MRADGIVTGQDVSGRNRVRFGGNFDRTREYHSAASERKANILEQRRVLGEQYLARHADRDSGYALPEDTAFAVKDFSHLPVVREAVEESRRFIESRQNNLTRSKGSLDFYSSSADYSDRSATVQLLWAPEILCPVIRYFGGVMPIMGKIEISQANANALMEKTSHMFHSDPDDVRQVKLFVHVSDIDEDCGPFHALPANLSEKIDATYNFPRGRLTDEQVEKVVGPDRTVASIGPAGTISFCDTTRCYHFGGRPPKPGKPRRQLIMPRYLLPTSTVYPLFAGDGEIHEPIPPVTPTDDPLWNAFIGADLVY